MSNETQEEVLADIKSARDAYLAQGLHQRSVVRALSRLDGTQQTLFAAAYLSGEVIDDGTFSDAADQLVDMIYTSNDATAIKVLDDVQAGTLTLTKEDKSALKNIYSQIETNIKEEESDAATLAALKERYNKLVSEVKTESSGTVDIDAMYSSGELGKFIDRTRTSNDDTESFIGDDEATTIGTFTYQTEAKREDESEEEYQSRLEEHLKRTKGSVEEFANASDDNAAKLEEIASLGALIEEKSASAARTESSLR